jgi:hypothetical protein
MTVALSVSCVKKLVRFPEWKRLARYLARLFHGARLAESPTVGIEPRYSKGRNSMKTANYKRRSRAKKRVGWKTEFWDSSWT